jgi:tRNA(Ile)-lysidine synthase
LPAPRSEILVGVSGGMDSVTLAWCLSAEGFRIVIGHVHHGLRGPSADDDLNLVRELANRLGAPFESRHARVKAEPRTSLQEAAREVRYDALADMAASRGIAHVAVGHHADDQAETLILNLARGAGPRGLGGMSPDRPFPQRPGLTLLRPLLHRSRSEILDFARANGLIWREDPTNADTRYRRNAVRKQVMPALKTVFGDQVAMTMGRAAEMLRAYEQADLGIVSRLLLDLGSAPLAAGHLRMAGGMIELDTLRALPEVWASRLVLDALDRWIPEAPRSQAAATEVTRLLDSQPGRFTAFGRGRVWRERGGLAFVDACPAPGVAHLEVSGTARYGRYVVSAEPARATPSEGNAGRIVVSTSGPFEIRPWRPGDRIELPGGPQKVKTILTEAGIPCFARSTAPVLTCQDQVLWVVGLGVSAHRVKPPGSLEGVALWYTVD